MPVNVVSPMTAAASADAAPSPTVWVAPVCAAALIGSLFLPWYTLTITAAGTPLRLGLASTAPQWMGTTSWVLATLALVVLLEAAASSRRSPFRDALPHVPRLLAAVWSLLAVTLILYRIITPPPVPGSPIEQALNVRPSVGPYVALVLALIMTVALARRPERTAA